MILLPIQPKVKSVTMPIEDVSLLLRHVNIRFHRKEAIEHLQSEVEASRNVDIRIGTSSNLMLVIKVALNVCHLVKKRVIGPQLCY